MIMVLDKCTTHPQVTICLLDHLPKHTVATVAIHASYWSYTPTWLSRGAQLVSMVKNVCFATVEPAAF